MFQTAHAVDEVFDYASFMWDSGDFWQQVSPDMNPNPGLEAHMLVGLQLKREQWTSSNLV